jgi:hypothetical protein
VPTSLDVFTLQFEKHHSQTSGDVGFSFFEKGTTKWREFRSRDAVLVSKAGHGLEQFSGPVPHTGVT